MTYLEALTLLGKRDRVKLMHNTYLVRRADTVDVVFHTSTIVTYGLDDSVTYYNAGWQTATTKIRLNTYGVTGISVYQERHKWYVRDHTNDTVEPFFNGMRVR